MVIDLRHRIAGHCARASWERLRLQRPGLVASGAGPEVIADWLEAASPAARTDAAALLRSLAAGPWWLDGQQPGPRHVVTLHRNGPWVLRLRAAPAWQVQRIERPARMAAALAQRLTAMNGRG